MRKALIAVILVLAAGVSYAQSHVKINKGNSADVYKVWVGSVSYNIITAEEAGALVDWAIQPLHATKSIWHDYDSSVSTGPAAQTSSPNGYLLNENGEIAAKDFFSPGGWNGAGVWINAGDPAGVEVQIWKFYAY